MLKKIKKGIREPIIILKYLISKGFFDYLPDKYFLQIFYYVHLKKWINFNLPKTFNEKLQWLKLYDRNPEYTVLVDKVKVRTYIAEKIGSQYLIELLGSWNSAYEIELDKLPEQFVLKCNHDSGSTILCTDKATFDSKTSFEKLEKARKTNYYKKGREWPYKHVIPQILAEPLLTNDADLLLDYKFMCFNGKVKCIFVCSEREKHFVKVTFFDREWKKMPLERHYPSSDKDIKKPANLELMIELAETLAENIPFVRVDFYEIDNKVLFGEMTFFPGSGVEEFRPEEYDYKFGMWLKLPQMR